MRARTLAATLALTALIAAPVWAYHNHLTKSLPADQDELTTAPTAIRLWFAEKPEANFSSITLYRADQTKVGVSKAKVTDDTLSISFDLNESIGPGSYTVAWRTAGTDGHAVRGKYGFTVKP